MTLRRITLLSLRLILLLIIAGTATATATAQQPSRRLLVIDTYNDDAGWHRVVNPVLLKIASDDDDININVTSIDTKAIDNDSTYNDAVDEIFTEFKGAKPDCLLLIGNFAFTLRERIKEEWGEVPIVLVAEQDRDIPVECFRPSAGYDESNHHRKLSEMRDECNFTFIRLPYSYEKTVDMMAGMLPKMKRLVFMSNGSYINTHIANLMAAYIGRKYPAISFEHLTNGVDQDGGLPAQLKENDGQTAVMFAWRSYTGRIASDQPLLTERAFTLLNMSGANLPVFSLSEEYIRLGMIGGYVYNDEMMRSNISNVLQQVIGGTNASEIAFTDSTEIYPLVNYAAMEAAGIPRGRCPENTVFINAPISMWEHYKEPIIISGIIMLALIGIVGHSHVNRNRRMRLYKIHESLIRNMPILYANGSVTFDSEGNATDIAYKSGNEAFHSLSDDLSLSNSIGIMGFEQILHFARLAVKEGQTVKFTHFFKNHNICYTFIICRAAEADSIDLFGIDITAQYKAEQHLRETNKKLEFTLDAARIIPWRWDLREGVISAEVPVPGSGAPSVMTTDAADYFKRILPDDRTSVREAYAALTDGHEHHMKIEYRTTRPSGEIDWIEVNAMVDKYDSSGAPLSLIGSMLVITDRKNREHDLIVAEEKAKESDKLKSAFLANMSHEIRTPLNAIVGFSSLMSASDDAGERQEYYSIIKTNNQLLLQLIGDILDLAKIEAGTLEFHFSMTDINALLHSLESTVRSRLQPRVELICLPGAERCMTITDPNRLSQVLINMLTNACKFTTNGHIMFGYEVRDRQLYFFVSDTGRGLSEEHQKTVFDRFMKVDSNMNGTGLGLSISRNIVARLGGEIGVTSEGEGLGCTFWFTHPYSGDNEQTDNTRETTFDGTDESGRRHIILIAEDNESNYTLLKYTLEKDYIVHRACNGEEAIEMFRNGSPDIVLMDLNMPKVDGYEAMREIRKISPNVPIIAVTAYASDSQRGEFLQKGFTGLITKPVDSGSLREELRRTIGRNLLFL